GGVHVRFVQHHLVARIRQALRDLWKDGVRARHDVWNAGAAYLGPSLHALHEQRDPLLVGDLGETGGRVVAHAYGVGQGGVGGGIADAVLIHRRPDRGGVERRRVAG